MTAPENWTGEGSWGYVSFYSGQEDGRQYDDKDEKLGEISASRFNFLVTSKGYLSAKNAYIEGTIYANDGYFKGDINAKSINLSNIIISNPTQLMPYSFCAGITTGNLKLTLTQTK